MNKQELLENYTMEQLADMVVDLQKENLVDILKLKNREDTEDVQKIFDAMRLTITELCNTIENLKEQLQRKEFAMMQVDDVLVEFFGVTHEIMDKPHDFELTLEKTIQKEIDNKINNNKTLADFLPTEPIKVADVLINSERKPTKIKALQIAFTHCLTEETKVSLFDVSELRQIAEHLLIYCNANGGLE